MLAEDAAQMYGMDAGDRGDLFQAQTRGELRLQELSHLPEPTWGLALCGRRAPACDLSQELQSESLRHEGGSGVRLLRFLVELNGEPGQPAAVEISRRVQGQRVLVKAAQPARVQRHAERSRPR